MLLVLRPPGSRFSSKESDNENANIVSTISDLLPSLVYQDTLVGSIQRHSSAIIPSFDQMAQGFSSNLFCDSKLLLAPQKHRPSSIVPNGTYQIVNVYTGAYAGLLDNNGRSQVVSFIPGLDGDPNFGTRVSPSSLSDNQISI